MDDNRLSWNNAYPTTIEGAREGTASLLSKVLGITALGFLITSLERTCPDWSTLPGVIAVFGLVLAINFTRKANPALALGMFLGAGLGSWGGKLGLLISYRYVRTIGPTVAFRQRRQRGWGWRLWVALLIYSRSITCNIVGVALAALLVLILLGVASICFQLHVTGYLFCG